MKGQTHAYAVRAAAAAPMLASSALKARNDALERVRAALDARADEIVAANKYDVAEAERVGLAAPLRKRLRFQQEGIADMCDAIASIIALPDPLGVLLDKRALDSDLILQRRSASIGTVGVVFESRPDALVQIASLCLKSGNCVLMKGGREAEHTNAVLAQIILSAVSVGGDIPDGWLTLLATRDEVTELISCTEEVDLIIPRGSNSFVQHIMAHSSIPVLGHADGVCHLFVDREADVAMAEALVIDGKTQYVAVCNALECLLVHAHIASAFLPRAVRALVARGVTVYGCARTREIMADDGGLAVGDGASVTSDGGLATTETATSAGRREAAGDGVSVASDGASVASDGASVISDGGLATTETATSAGRREVAGRTAVANKTAANDKEREMTDRKVPLRTTTEMVQVATEAHWGKEYLSLALSIRIVDSMEDAVAHINTYGSKHTDAIVTADAQRAMYFMHRVDSASVLHNCSTRFSDGYRYGLGAEIGISTSKIHARGPVGLEGLLTYKWYLAGNGHVVSDYSGKNARTFLHKVLRK